MTQASQTQEYAGQSATSSPDARREGNGRRQGPRLLPGPRGRAQRQGGGGRQQQRHVNVGDGERAVSVAAGAILAIQGLSRGSLPGLLIAGVGGALAYRGVTGHCHAYEAMGLDTAHGAAGGEGGRSEEDDEIAERGVHIAQAFLIHRPAAELYGFWRNFENLPRIMTHLESVRVLEGDGRRSHWVAKAKVPGGQRLEWDAEITRDVPGERIAWRSLPGADVDNSGEIRFSAAPGDRGTLVRVSMNYVPPAGRIGHWVAALLGQNPKRIVREDLRNFKRVMEVGEILTILGQPHGTCTGQGERYTETEWKPLFT